MDKRLVLICATKFLYNVGLRLSSACAQVANVATFAVPEPWPAAFLKLRLCDAIQNTQGTCSQHTKAFQQVSKDEAGACGHNT
jgi:hypothetical protein